MITALGEQLLHKSKEVMDLGLSHLDLQTDFRILWDHYQQKLALIESQQKQLELNKEDFTDSQQKMFDLESQNQEQKQLIAHKDAIIAQHAEQQELLQQELKAIEKQRFGDKMAEGQQKLQAKELMLRYQKQEKESLEMKKKVLEYFETIKALRKEIKELKVRRPENRFMMSFKKESEEGTPTPKAQHNPMQMISKKVRIDTAFFSRRLFAVEEDDEERKTSSSDIFTGIGLELRKPAKASDAESSASASDKKRGKAAARLTQRKSLIAKTANK